MAHLCQQQSALAKYLGHLIPSALLSTLAGAHAMLGIASQPGAALLDVGKRLVYGFGIALGWLSGSVWQVAGDSVWHVAQVTLRCHRSALAHLHVILYSSSSCILYPRGCKGPFFDAHINTPSGGVHSV